MSNKKSSSAPFRETFTFEGKRYDIKAQTEKELILKVDAKKRALEQGSIIYKKGTTVKRWAEEWLETYKRNSVEAATFYAYQNRFNAHIYPVIGHLKLTDVKPIHLQKIINGLSGCSRDHIKKMHYTLQQLFSDAYRNKLILINPAESLIMPAAISKTRRSITDVERKYILKVAGTHSSGLWIKTMLYCGLRPAETAALQGRHIDLKNGVIKVEGSLKRHGNTIGSTKTASGIRKVPMPDILLQEYKQLKLEPFDYVFKNADGGHMTSGGMRTRWRSFERALNIEMGCKVINKEVQPPFRVAEDLVPYCLRHTYCTDLQSAGVPINVAKELMGHKDISITAKIYTHHSEIAFDNARDLINKLNSKTSAADDENESKSK